MTNNPDEFSDPMAGILEDLENLRRTRASDTGSEHGDDPGLPEIDSQAQAVLDSIADVAGQLRDGENDSESGTSVGEDAHSDAESSPTPRVPEHSDQPASDQIQNSSTKEDVAKSETAGTEAQRGFAEAIFSNLPQAETPQDFLADTAEQDPNAEVPAPASLAFDLRNPFAFLQEQSVEDLNAAQALAAPSGGALTFQAPQAELGQVVDPNWTPEAEDEESTFDASDDEDDDSQSRRRRGGRGRRSRKRREDDRQDTSEDAGNVNETPADQPETESVGTDETADAQNQGEAVTTSAAEEQSTGTDSTRRRRRRVRSSQPSEDSVTGVKGSTRLEAKRQRRKEGREAGRRRPVITEAEFLARREAVERTMLVREKDGRTQLVVLEDGVAVEHYLSESRSQTSLIGNIYLGKVQNVLPSMEAAFIDIGKGRNAVLYAGEVNWDALGMDGKVRRIETALNPGDSVLVQVTKDPVGHKGARLTSQVSLPGRFLVFVPGSQMTGISRKLPDVERARLKKLLSEVVPENNGVIVRTAAEGAAEAELARDVERLAKRWESIEKKSQSTKVLAPQLLYSEPDMIVRIIRDVFNEDFTELVISGTKVTDTITEYVEAVAPDLMDRVSTYSDEQDIFDKYRVSEQIDKALNRKVNLPSGGSLVIDRTEAMTVIDVNTGKFTGSGGNLEETVTKNNLEAAEEVIRQLRLRDIGGIIVVDFIDMVLEANRDLVLRRLVECLGRDRTKHQVAEVTSLGLVQMTRKRIGTGLAESFAAAGEDMTGRGLMLPGTEPDPNQKQFRSRKKNRKNSDTKVVEAEDPQDSSPQLQASRDAMAAIAKATIKPAKSDGTATAQDEHPWTEADSSSVQVATAEETQPSQETTGDTGPANTQAESVSVSEPNLLLIGADTETRIQQAPVKTPERAQAEKPDPQTPKRADKAQQKDDAVLPFLIIGDD